LHDFLALFIGSPLDILKEVNHGLAAQQICQRWSRRDLSLLQPVCPPGHRKTWIVHRLRHLAALFAIEVCAYAVMENHYHAILRLRPDIVATWSDWEVATRWLTLFPRHHTIDGTALPPTDLDVLALTHDPERIAQLRQRLCSLSWFMGRLNEFIARAANKEDKVKGRFWESRFKCQVLLDDASIATCMVYVDLNPIRAGLAATPEESDFTSIQERIRSWQQDTRTEDSAFTQAQNRRPGSPVTGMSIPENAGESLELSSEYGSTLDHSLYADASSADWLCPISSDSQKRGILQMTPAEYFNLVDQSGRIIRSGKRGAIDADLMPILLRIGANPDAWLETISSFGSRFRLAAGLLSNLRNFANRLGRRWITGVAAARTAFAKPSPQLS
jgi:REP element-mobilizing transposase RayT